MHSLKQAGPAVAVVSAVSHEIHEACSGLTTRPTVAPSPRRLLSLAGRRAERNAQVDCLSLSRTPRSNQVLGPSPVSQRAANACSDQGQALNAGQCPRLRGLCARKHLVLHALNSQALEWAVPPQLCCVILLHILAPSGRRRLRCAQRHEVITRNRLGAPVRCGCVHAIVYRCLQAAAPLLRSHATIRELT